jgi:GT2 family glycosyltransferase
MDSAGLKMLNTGEILPRGHGKASSGYNNPENVTGFCAGACLINLWLIDELGGFDPFFDTGYEDAELSLRAFVGGKKIVYEPQSVVYHKMGQSLIKVKTYRRTLKIMRDVQYTALKNLPILVLAASFPFVFIRNVLVLIIFALSFRFRYIKIFFHALWYTFFVDFPHVRKHRRVLSVKIRFFDIIRAQEFFLKHDIYRFYQYILKNTPHKFEQ